ncbi:MAG: hypothetical protein ABSB74_06810 [Tepidisphaeraceae bacterium]
MIAQILCIIFLVLFFICCGAGFRFSDKAGLFGAAQIFLGLSVCCLAWSVYNGK